MTREETSKLVKELDWSQPKSVQEHAIAALTKTEESNYDLLLNKDMKFTWENAVKVIKNIGYPKNKSLIPDLIWLLLDVNWPGAWESVEMLSKIDKKTVIPYLENALHEADADNDYMWIGGIKCVVDIGGLTADDFSDKSAYDILKKADF